MPGTEQAKPDGPFQAEEAVDRALHARHPVPEQDASLSSGWTVLRRLVHRGALAAEGAPGSQALVDLVQAIADALDAAVSDVMAYGQRLARR